MWLGGRRKKGDGGGCQRLVVSTVLDRGRRNQEPGGHQCVGSERTAREGGRHGLGREEQEEPRRPKRPLPYLPVERGGKSKGYGTG